MDEIAVLNDMDKLRLENLDLKLQILQQQFTIVKHERDVLAAKLNGAAEEK